MTLVIGTDEAGYGPNLGPLVVAATAWRVDADPHAVEERLESAVVAAAPGLWGDSKKIYRAGAGLDALEWGVLAAISLATHGVTPTSWSMLPLDEQAAPPEGSHRERLSIPRHPPERSAADQAITITTSLAASGVHLETVRARVVQPAEFNALLATGLNKSDILSQVTLDLAASLLFDTGDEPCLVWCDRHGGRRRYAPLVARAFDVSLVRPIEETASRSGYEFGSGRRIEFSVGGEARLPVGVASMTAKYLRELSMLAFNDFWSERVPGLAPTAGYPVDAVRWRREAFGIIEATGLPWDAIWRRA